MITGFNTNVRYRGRVFHVQTEDSGKQNPHIISHLYHGGTIIASEKRKYDEHLDSENLENEVRSLMEAQHKALLRRLKDGEFDGPIGERLEGEAPVEASVGEATTSPELVDVPPEPASEPAPAAAAPAAGDDDRAFGDGIVSQKPLDELILEHLVEKARERGGRSSGRAARSRSRSPAKG